ncbi:hypothetical protein [Jeotgalicoccus halotolerans]|uniref:hypothetical protein n=1 Tax=Jeotgalicoccus halotolerans TaxID=157227 RepID=UPI0039EF43BC
MSVYVTTAGRNVTSAGSNTRAQDEAGNVYRNVCRTKQDDSRDVSRTQGTSTGTSAGR